MAQQGKSDELVTLQEIAVSNSYEIAALVAVLERKGVLTQQEVLDKITRLKHKDGEGAVGQHTAAYGRTPRTRR